MKTLYLLRHAKAVKGEELSDTGRPLSKKGHIQADAVSDHLSSLIPPPKRVICSPAIRTRETLDYFLEVWPQTKTAVSFPEALYLANKDTLFSQVQGISNKADIALLVGHNPGLSIFARKLLRPETEELEDMKPSAFIQIDFEVDDWADVTPHTGWIKLNLWPKKLEN
ncbi:histidine phosphatase family protein [Kiritimatiellota bacterium B12222]|nr:histidine phosphatase family protein [Kiritimatiellota bacterium B12222]